MKNDVLFRKIPGYMDNKSSNRLKKESEDAADYDRLRTNQEVHINRQ